MATAYRKKLAEMKDSEHPFAKYVRILGKGKTGSRSLTQEEAQHAMSMIMRNEVEDIQLGAFLMLLRVKEESHQELAGFVSSVRENIDLPQQNINIDLDWSSYAGKKRQLPWFILSCLTLADQGYKIYMHGAQGHTIGRLYTEDVLKALGIAICQNWHDVNQELTESNFAFMPLSALAPELHRIIAMRNYLGLRSPVHTLCRLINPLLSDHSMQSIFHPAYGDSHQQAAIALGQPNAAVFKGEGGEVERKPEANCVVKQVVDGNISESTWPKLLEGRQVPADQLDINYLVSIWRGEAKDDYAENAIIGTTAIAIQLLKPTLTNQQSMDLGRDYWQRRNQARL